MVALLIPIIWIGVQPEPLLRRIEPSIIVMMDQMRSRAEVVGVKLLDGLEEPHDAVVLVASRAVTPAPDGGR